MCRAAYLQVSEALGQRGLSGLEGRARRSAVRVIVHDGTPVEIPACPPDEHDGLE